MVRPQTPVVHDDHRLLHPQSLSLYIKILYLDKKVVLDPKRMYRGQFTYSLLPLYLEFKTVLLEKHYILYTSWYYRSLLLQK